MAEEAAQEVSQTNKKKAIRSAMKKPALKTNLCTPYSVKWPHIPQDSIDFVLKELKREFQKVELHFPVDVMKSKDPAAYKEYKALKKDDKIEFRRQKITEMVELTGHNSLRSQLAIGFNCVNKALERNQLRLVLASRESWNIVRHLAQLATVRGCPGMAIDGLSSTVAPLLGVSSVTVLGFKKIHEGDAPDFSDLVQTISSRCVPIDLPWLSLEQELMEIKQESHSSEEEDEISSPPKRPKTVRYDGEEDVSSPKTIEPAAPEKKQEEKVDYSHFYILKRDRKPNGPLIFENEDIERVTAKRQGFGKEEFISFDHEHPGDTSGSGRRDSDSKNRALVVRGTKQMSTHSKLQTMVLGRVQANTKRKSRKK